MAKRTTRPRGFAQYNPKPEGLQLINNVIQVLNENREYLPLTLRQIFYRLVVKDQVPKTERGYKDLCEKMNRARRAEMIPMNAIRDDGFNGYLWQGYQNEAAFINDLKNEAEVVKLDLQDWQDTRIIVWCEAAGMKPQLESVASKYSIPVVSSGGFDSVTAKHDGVNTFKTATSYITYW